MRGSQPFAQDFASRVELLKEIPISRARQIVAEAPVNAGIVRFLRENPERCRIMTGNLDVWIEGLIDRIGMRGRCFCSRASVDGDWLTGISCVLNKERACRALKRPLIAIGDGSNDVDMLRTADVGIAFGGVRALSAELVQVADRVVTDEGELVAYLRQLL